MGHDECARERIASITGFCSTEDSSVRATVDSNGVLVRLELTPTTRQVSEAALASVITATVQQAVADMRNQVRDVLLSVRDEGYAVDVPPPVPVSPVTLHGVTPRPVPPPRGEEEPGSWVTSR